MSETQIKIRYGLILQGVFSRALSQAGFEFDETVLYEEGCEVPDFLLPNVENPRFMVEVHQTEARDHFRMMTLRSLTAVAEAKAHFGDDLITVNVLFGDPYRELPESNVRAMCGLFDSNIILRDEGDADALQTMELEALALARDLNLTTAVAAQRIAGQDTAAVRCISRVVRSRLRQATTREELHPWWQMERQRRASLPRVPSAGEPTYYKRNILRSLFVSDEHFTQLLQDLPPSQWSEELKQQLLRTGLVSVEEGLAPDGSDDQWNLDYDFAQFLRDPKAPRLRELCEVRLAADSSMRWFFSDITNRDRRLRMCEIFLDAVAAGRLEQALRDNMSTNTLLGIRHERTWFVDLITRYLGISQNTLSRRLYTTYPNPGRFGDPVSHIAPKTQRYRGLTSDAVRSYAGSICDAFRRFSEERGVGFGAISAEQLQTRLLELRLLGVGRLQKLNPLYLIIESLCQNLDLTKNYAGTNSIVSDLAGAAQSVGRYLLYHISDGTSTILANAIAADDNPQDKAKEWGARRLATLYRFIDGEVQSSGYPEGLFVIDGIWDDDDVLRLHKCGWTRVVRLDDLETVLSEMFDG